MTEYSVDKMLEAVSAIFVTDIYLVMWALDTYIPNKSPRS